MESFGVVEGSTIWSPMILSMYSSRGMIEISPPQLAHSLSPARLARAVPRPRVRLHQGWRVLLDVFL